MHLYFVTEMPEDAVDPTPGRVVDIDSCECKTEKCSRVYEPQCALKHGSDCPYVCECLDRTCIDLPNIGVLRIRNLRSMFNQ
jgi:hypothetical protein